MAHDKQGVFALWKPLSVDGCACKHKHSVEMTRSCCVIFTLSLGSFFPGLQKLLWFNLSNIQYMKNKFDLFFNKLDVLLRCYVT